ncbi:MAG: carboxypeptidase regulatory-like domain-containing protein [Planctomycetales bacterium]|nr:carboxypeptidase regulatory-like domain-containing protein [Planctomycetales bacterium]
MRNLLRQCSLLAIAVTTIGCGSGDIGYVEGTVKLDGQPLPNAMLEFYPQDKGGLSSGRTDANGHYELYYGREGKGAEVGEHLVQIRTAGVGDAGGDYGPTSKERIPVQYNNKSELVRKVESGRNTIDFDLESKGKIVQPPSGY